MVHLCSVRTVKLNKQRPSESRSTWSAPNPEGAVVYYRLAEKQRSLSLEVVSPSGKVLATLPGPAEPGPHAVSWQPGQAVSGEYRVRLRTDGQTITRELVIESSE
jgi:hypothetical protein